MSKQQQLELDAILRQGQLDLGADVPTLRAGFNDVMARVPVAARRRVGRRWPGGGHPPRLERRRHAAALRAFLMSPYADLTLSGETILEKQAVDPILTPDGLRLRVPDYVAAADAADPHISPVFGDFSRLPPLLIQVGSHEILLSDALRLAARAATADVQITLEVTPGCPHVFQGFAAVLDEGDAALDPGIGLFEDAIHGHPAHPSCLTSEPTLTTSWRWKLEGLPSSHDREVVVHCTVHEAPVGRN